MSATSTEITYATDLIREAEIAGASANLGQDLSERAAHLVDLLEDRTPLPLLLSAASAKRDSATGNTLSYSPKVFIDLTRLCRDRCSYCTFIRTPVSQRIPLRVEGGGEVTGEPMPYLDAGEVLEIAAAGASAGCKEALFTLGDRPEDRYESARRFLSANGFSSTAEYVVHCAEMVFEETGLLPHVNPGVMTPDEIREYRNVSVSAGLMLESTSRALYEDPGGCHFGSPDKDPAARLACIADAGEARVPFTTGMLIGIGETLQDRVETILTMSALANGYGHIQEVIVQNFRAKAAIPMRDHVEPGFREYLRVIALARLILPKRVAVQAPPNLTPRYDSLLDAGISDWGGISPVTPDHVNPEAPWPEVQELRTKCGALGFEVRPRLAIHPAFITEGGWLDPRLEDAVAKMSDPMGWAL